jgi:ribosomal protein L7/L12
VIRQVGLKEAKDLVEAPRPTLAMVNGWAAVTKLQSELAIVGRDSTLVEVE